MKRKFLALFGCLLLLLPGCLPEKAPEENAVTPLPYHLVLEWSSALANPYYVLAGPGVSYRRFPFNDWAQTALRQRLALRSGPSSAPTVRVVVHLQQLTTDYSEIGAAPAFGRMRYAGLGGFVGVLSDDNDEDGGPPTPEDIFKSAQLTGELRLVRDDKVLLRRSLSAKVRQQINWQDFDSWTYDYGSVLKQVIRIMVSDVDQALVGELDRS